MNPYSTETETNVLRWYASKAKKGIVEIGVLNGETTKVMGAVATVPIYGIDPFVEDSMSPGLIGNKQKVMENMTDCKNFTLYEAYSHDIVGRFNHEFDMIFIDGDHRYESVKKDVEDWWPRLAVGGMMFIHDSAPVVSVSSEFKGHEGPVRLVREMAASCKKVGAWDTITGFKKEKAGPVVRPRYTIGYAFHDKEDLATRIIDALSINVGDKAQYSFIFDGCKDETEKIVRNLSASLYGEVDFKITPDIFELASNNLLLQSFSTDFLIIFQDDMILRDPNMLKNLDACIDKYPYSIGVIGCRSGFFSGYSDMASSAFDKNENTKRILAPGETSVVWMVNRGPIVISAELRRAIGLIDVSYGKSGAFSEMDYCLQAARAGFVNVAMGLAMEHIRNFNKALTPLDNEARKVFIKKWPEVLI